MIRRATPADAAAVTEVHTRARAAWASPTRPAAIDEATRAARLSRDEARTSVSEREGAVPGFASVYDVGDDDLAGRPIGEVLARRGFVVHRVDGDELRHRRKP